MAQFGRNLLRNDHSKQPERAFPPADAKDYLVRIADFKKRQSEGFSVGFSVPAIIKD